MKPSNNCLCLLHTSIYMRNILSPAISKQTYLNRECNRLGMSTLQGTFSSMRISDQEALKLSSFSVPFVISIHFSVFPGYIYIRQHTRKVIHLWPATVLLWSDIWHGTQTFFLAKACKKTSPSSLYFKMILHPVSVFLRNYFFLLTASGQKLFRKKTLQTAQGCFKISQMRRFTFHLTSLRYSDRHVI